MQANDINNSETLESLKNHGWISVEEFKKETLYLPFIFDREHSSLNQLKEPGLLRLYFFLRAVVMEYLETLVTQEISSIVRIMLKESLNKFTSYNSLHKDWDLNHSFSYLYEGFYDENSYDMYRLQQVIYDKFLSYRFSSTNDLAHYVFETNYDSPCYKFSKCTVMGFPIIFYNRDYDIPAYMIDFFSHHLSLNVHNYSVINYKCLKNTFFSPSVQKKLEKSRSYKLNKNINSIDNDLYWSSEIGNSF